MIGRRTESLTGPTRTLFARFLTQAVLTTESPTGPVNILERKYYGTDRPKMGPFHNIYVYGKYLEFGPRILRRGASRLSELLHL